jgi:hypothetical protein
VAATSLLEPREQQQGPLLLLPHEVARDEDLVGSFAILLGDPKPPRRPSIKLSLHATILTLKVGPSQLRLLPETVQGSLVSLEGSTSLFVSLGLAHRLDLARDVLHRD